MKTTLLRLLSLLAWPLMAAAAPAARPADAAVLAAVRAADDARIAATTAGDRKGLEAIYSDALHYAHSNGRVDTKASQIKGLAESMNQYKFEYKDRTFDVVAPGIVLMKGRMLMHLTHKTTGQKSTNDLNFLAVWREEKGKWRFLAWQSCRNPDAAAPAKK